MRGKAAALLTYSHRYGITPAYAGKSPQGECCSVHGDGSPPRMRGKGAIPPALSFPKRITPAYAGKRYPVLPACFRVGDHPRVCGEKWYSLYGTMRKTGSPPRMRGKANPGENERKQYGITPAYAGKRFFVDEVLPGDTDHPRVCGEKLRFAPRYAIFPGSPPRMRGKVYSIRCGVSCIEDHPRVCGEKRTFLEQKRQARGSPPRMRGKES